MNEAEKREWQRRIAEKLGMNIVDFGQEISGLGGATTYFAKAEDHDGLSVPIVVKIGTKEELQNETSALEKAKKKFNNNYVCDPFGKITVAAKSALIMGRAGHRNA